MRKKSENKKGFTLAELLVVVAIVAVLVAIAIPIFTMAQEKSAEAVDLANIRSAYAEITVKYLENSSSATISVPAKQTQPSWQRDGNNVSTKLGSEFIYGGISDGALSQSIVVSYKTSGSYYKVQIDGSGKVTVE